ncbi:Signal transduction histidine-protein kinase/phosphatase DegS [Isoptericola dokdonensis DS-3]|uniref:histidine kinase n=2 Tax=Isoptericola TaxID=254250 RepID=A0A168F722_9MICO|nr:Signal transduction histidine-protein kinase/phosphatase DegS [Isoptericola dokdonensis DS-3]
MLSPADPDDVAVIASILAMLTGFVLAGCLVLRRQYPVPLCVAASVAPMLLPMDSAAALLTLPWVWAVARGRTVALCTAAVTAGTAAALWRDAARPAGEHVFSVVDEAGVLSYDPGPVAFVGWGLLFLGLSVAAGIVRRSRAATASARRDTRDAREQTAAEVARSAVLQDRMTRQEERELIAREVHDTVAHHIASISLRASVLEVQHPDDAPTRDAAREVRASAQRAVAELRTLLHSLRTDDGDLLPGTTLEDLVPLLDRLRAGGTQVWGTVFVTDSHLAAPHVTRATFRIVQEAVTNALKHAPDRPVSVTVRAGRGSGVEVRVENPLGTGAPGPGTGHGITGMQERAERLGGSLTAGRDGDRFVVTARLPWAEVGVDPQR